MTAFTGEHAGNDAGGRISASEPRAHHGLGRVVLAGSDTLLMGPLRV